MSAAHSCRQCGIDIEPSQRLREELFFCGHDCLVAWAAFFTAGRWRKA